MVRGMIVSILTRFLVFFARRLRESDVFDALLITALSTFAFLAFIGVLAAGLYALIYADTLRIHPLVTLAGVAFVTLGVALSPAIVRAVRKAWGDVGKKDKE